MARRSSFGSIMRKRLSDITNALPQPKPSSEDASSSAKDYIESLTKVIYIYIYNIYVCICFRPF